MPSDPATTTAVATPATPRTRSRTHYLLLAAATLAPITLIALGLALHPDPRGVGTHQQLGLAPCLPMELWNIPCPGCGVTTSATLFAQGHPLKSLVTQPFGFLLSLAMVLALPVALAMHLLGQDLATHARRHLTWRLGGIVLTLAGLAWVWKIWLVRWG